MNGVDHETIAQLSQELANTSQQVLVLQREVETWRKRFEDVQGCLTSVLRERDQLKAQLRYAPQMPLGKRQRRSSDDGQ